MNLKQAIKRVTEPLGIRSPFGSTKRNLLFWSIKQIIAKPEFSQLYHKLCKLMPDISNQEACMEGVEISEYDTMKRRALQTFQLKLLLEEVRALTKKDIVVVDIGDSAGTHMFYLKKLAESEGISVETLSVNLDPRAIKKITERGMKAILCRAEDLDLGKKEIDLFTTFQMVEHLHNPSIFFRRLAVKGNSNRILMTVPYLKQSRVGFHEIRIQLKEKVFAEDVHVFELSPEDWALLLMHSGWKVVKSEIFYQYPTSIPLLSRYLSNLWKTSDFEGFLGLSLERDMTFSNFYQDWEE